jgi:hypothetical protein
MSMYNYIKDIMKVLWNDEELLRLAFYPAENRAENILDPLDEKLENILDKDEIEQWEIRDNHILSVPKSSDFEDEVTCKIFVYAGRRSPTRNYQIADQDIVVDILCHAEYENGDLRTMRISDKINELLISERITGMGKIRYVGGNPIPSPEDYVGYRHTYEFGSMTK